MVKTHAVAVTTNSSGVATGYTPPMSGRILSISYVPHGTTPLDTGAVITITGNTTAIPIVTITSLGTAARTVTPRQATHDVAAAAALYAGGGSAVLAEIPVADEAVKVAVASGDNTKSGTFYVTFDGA